jgi:general secretion pathway protein B
MPVVVNAHSPPPATPTAKPVPTTPMIAATAAPEPAAKPATLGSVHSASGGIPTLAELPETVRRQIPNINISGAVNSDSPADGALIINDQVMGKGGQVAPELRLEEVNANSAVFNFKGQRFRIDR